jgi:hypothetical protein
MILEGAASDCGGGDFDLDECDSRGGGCGSDIDNGVREEALATDFGCGALAAEDVRERVVGERRVVRGI